MGIFQRKRRNRSFEDSNRRFLAKTSGVTPDWLASLIQGSLAANYDEYEAGAGISTSDAFQAQYNYKTMLEQMAFNAEMQDDAQAFNAEMQANSQAFNSAEAEKQRSWEEQMYNQYQSPQAMARQYEQAGLNPALAMTGGAQGPTSMNGAAASAGSGATSGAASAASASVGDMGAGISNLPGGQMLLEMLGMFTDGIGSVSRIYDEYRDAHLKRSQEHYYDELKENTRVDSQLKEAQARIASIDADYRAAQNQMGLAKDGTWIEERRQAIDESLSRMQVNDSVISVNNKKISWIKKDIEQKDFQIAQSIAQTTLTNWQAETLRETLDFQKRLMDTQAQHYSSSSDYFKAMEAQVDAWLDAGGPNEQVNNLKQQVRSMETHRKLSIVDCIFGNLVNVANAVTGIVFPYSNIGRSGGYTGTTTTTNFDSQGVMTGGSTTTVTQTPLAK